MKNKERDNIKEQTIIALDLKYNTIKEGDRFTSYKDLCKYLDVPTVSGNSKKSQLIQFERYFTWENVGNSFIIKHVYDEPLADITDGIYSGLIKQLILDMLSKRYLSGKEHLTMSFTELIYEMDLVNNDYGNYKNDSHRLANELGITFESVVDFYNITDSKLYSSVVSALNSMKNRVLIDYQVIKMIRTVKENPIGYEYITRPADVEERQEILYYEKTVLNDMGYSTKTDIVINRKWNEFSKRIKRYFNENGLDYIDFYYNAFDIVFNENILLENDKIKDYLIRNNSEIKNILNKRVVDAHKESYIKRHEKAISLYNMIESDEIDDLWGYKKDRLDLRADGKYIENGHKLIDKTIKKTT
jgi:hypothetical protein